MSTIYLRGRVYWYKATVDGKPRYQSLKTGNRRIAVALKKKLDKKHSNPTSKPVSNDSIKCWVDIYLAWPKPSVSKQHYDHCQSRLSHFVAYCGGILPETITVEIVQDYLGQLGSSLRFTTTRRAFCIIGLGGKIRNLTSEI